MVFLRHPGRAPSSLTCRGNFTASILSGMRAEAKGRRAAPRAALLATLVLAACTASDTKPPRTTASGAAAAAAPPAVSRAPIAASPSSSPGAAPAVTVPADALYVCVTQKDGMLQQTAIEFVDKVGELCRRHPEMGPCQYERNTCRARGGRVFATGGVEITPQTEAEYDRKVMRTRLRAN